MIIGVRSGRTHSSQQGTIYTSIKLPQKVHWNAGKLAKFQQSGKTTHEHWGKCYTFKEGQRKPGRGS